jgi:prophage DNA circulation protein
MSTTDEILQPKRPPTPLPDLVAEVEAMVNAVVTNLESKISNTLDTPLKQIQETSALLEKTSQAAIDTAVKSAESKTDAIISQGQAIVDETTKLIEDAVQSVENVAAVISEEEKRITETITRLSITMEQQTEKAATLMTRVKNFVKLILSCIKTKDKSVEAPVSTSA